MRMLESPGAAMFKSPGVRYFFPAEACHSRAALCGSSPARPCLCHIASAMVSRTLAAMWGRSLSISSSNDEIHWSLL